MNTIEEIWKDVKCYEGIYQVSNYGRVRSLNYHLTKKTRLLKPYINPHGYHMYTLLKKQKRWYIFAHRLVYMTFIGDLPKFDRNGKGKERLEINHIDENKSNNAVWNLELISHFDNNNYGTRNKRISEQIKQRKTKKVYQYSMNDILIREWDSIMECDKHGFGFRKVSACCLGKIKSSMGYKWSYKKLKS